MTTQWHPLLAKVLRPVVESHYEIQTNVPVGDAPRMTDILLLRRTTDAPPPFQGLWANLTTWNVLEFKGPTVSPRVRDLDLLLELGLGIDRRLNEERGRQRLRVLERREVSFWYVGNRLGTRFLRDAGQLLGPLEPAGNGIWRCSVLRRMIFLISSAELPINGESVPLHLVGLESPETTLALARFLVERPALWRRYGAFLATYHRRAWERVLAMAKTKKKTFEPDWEPLLTAIQRDKSGKLLRNVLKCLGSDVVMEEIGKDLLETMDWDDFVAHLSPRDRDELKRRLQ